MYAPTAHRSLISFKELRANGIHTTTVMKNNQEALELRQGTEVLMRKLVGYMDCLLLMEFTHIMKLRHCLRFVTATVGNLTEACRLYESTCKDWA